MPTGKGLRKISGHIYLSGARVRSPAREPFPGKTGMLHTGRNHRPGVKLRHAAAGVRKHHRTRISPSIAEEFRTPFTGDDFRNIRNTLPRGESRRPAGRRIQTLGGAGRGNHGTPRSFRCMAPDTGIPHTVDTGREADRHMALRSDAATVPEKGEPYGQD